MKSKKKVDHVQILYNLFQKIKNMILIVSNIDQKVDYSYGIQLYEIILKNAILSNFDVKTADKNAIKTSLYCEKFIANICNHISKFFLTISPQKQLFYVRCVVSAL